MVSAVVVLRLRRRHEMCDRPIPRLGVDRPKVVSRRSEPDGATVRRGSRQLSRRGCSARSSPRCTRRAARVPTDSRSAEALALDIDDVSGRRPGDDDHRSATRCRRSASFSTPTALVPSGDASANVESAPSSSTNGHPSPTTPHRLTRFGADHLIRQLRTDDTTEQVTANALRRFHISTRRAEGTPLDIIRQGAGLSALRSLQRYDQPDPTGPIDFPKRRVNS